MADLFEKNEGDEKIVADTADDAVLSVDSEEGATAPAGEEFEVHEEKKQGWAADLFDVVETFCYALVLMTLVFVFVIRFVTVDGPSMNHTLQHEDKLIISDLFYTPETGDIVIIDTDGVDKLENIPYIVKRVIATGGQSVNIDFNTWQVKVDGKLLKEDYVNYLPGSHMNRGQTIYNQAKAETDGTYTLTVPEGMVFVMGDNRNNSTDSREVGFFHESSILGRVLLRVSPTDNFGRVK